MKHCSDCNIDIAGDLDRCPLCATELTGSPSPSAFPANKIAQKSMRALEILTLITVLGVIAFALAYAGHAFGIRALISGICGLLVNFVFIRNIIIHSTGFMRIVQRYFLILLAIAIIWFLVVQDSDITTFIIPAITLTALCMNAVLVIIFRSQFVKGYAKYMIFEIALGILPMVLMLIGLVSWPYLAYACLGMALVSVLLMVLFAHRQTKAELKKLLSA